MSPARSLLALIVVASVACSAHQQAPSPAAAADLDGYAVRTSYPLTLAHDQMQGRIELLEDARIRPSMRKAIEEAYGGDPCADHPDASLRTLCIPGHAPLRPAMLRLVDGHGRVLATRLAERPLAQLDTAAWYGTPQRRSYLFTVDLSAGMGSYSGPYTRIAEPVDGSFGWLTVDSAGVVDTLTLVSTMKTAWKAVGRADGQPEELLMVSCRPDLNAPADSVAFMLSFERFTFDGQRWVLHTRQEPGCYESDEPFPALSRFPTS